MPGCAFSVIDRRAGPEEPPVLSLSGGKKPGSQVERNSIFSVSGTFHGLVGSSGNDL